MTAFNKAGRYAVCVGRGVSAVNAKDDAVKGIKAYGAVSKPNVMQEDFSFGVGSKNFKFAR